MRTLSMSDKVKSCLGVRICEVVTFQDVKWRLMRIYEPGVFDAHQAVGQSLRPFDAGGLKDLAERRATPVCAEIEVVLEE